MLKEERKVGPKGQVVIPKTFRKTKKIEPGTNVVFEMTARGILIKKSEEKTEEVFEEVANSGSQVKNDIKPNESHIEELEERL